MALLSQITVLGFGHGREKGAFWDLGFKEQQRARGISEQTTVTPRPSGTPAKHLFKSFSAALENLLSEHLTQIWSHSGLAFILNQNKKGKENPHTMQRARRMDSRDVLAGEWTQGESGLAGLLSKGERWGLIPQACGGRGVHSMCRWTDQLQHLFWEVCVWVSVCGFNWHPLAGNNPFSLHSRYW